MIGNRITAARTRMGMSQQDQADRIGAKPAERRQLGTRGTDIHYYRIAKETLDGIGANGYTLLIDAPWDDSWGITNLRTREISISTTAPEQYVPSIALHEYGHIEQAKRGVTEDSDALEVEADQYACSKGATWVWYLGSCP